MPKPLEKLDPIPEYPDTDDEQFDSDTDGEEFDSDTEEEDVRGDNFSYQSTSEEEDDVVKTNTTQLIMKEVKRHGGEINVSPPQNMTLNAPVSPRAAPLPSNSERLYAARKYNPNDDARTQCHVLERDLNMFSSVDELNAKLDSIQKNILDKIKENVSTLKELKQNPSGLDESQKNDIDKKIKQYSGYIVKDVVSFHKEKLGPQLEKILQENKSKPQSPSMK